MAKSLRSKAKNTARRVKREGGEYHVHHAARLDRLNARLLSGNSNKEAIGKEGEQEEEGVEEVLAEGEEKMEGAASPTPTTSEPKISTSGPRGNRRETWRESKGMKPRATLHGLNSKGQFMAKRKAGRPGRRR